MAVNAARSDSLLGRLLRLSDIFLAVAVVTIVGMMIIPLPTFLLDFLLVADICSALTILLLAMYTTEPLQFSVFPALLLMITLCNLWLNIAATRLNLPLASAGAVISAIGTVV